MIRNFFNTLDKNNKSIDDKNYNSFINNFITDLKEHLAKLQSTSLLSSLRPYSLLTYAKNDGNFAVCFNYNEKKIYYVPNQKIIGTKPEPGEALKVNPDGTFHVDYTAILAEENKINDYLKECTIAKD